MALGGSCSFCCWLDSSIISCMNRTPSSAATVLTAWKTRWYEMPAWGDDNQVRLLKFLSLLYLWGVLDQLHSAIFQVDEADSHPPQQLQMFRVVCHEVLSPERRATHARLPEKRKNENNPAMLPTHSSKYTGHTCKEQGGGSSCPQHYGSVLLSYEERPGQETGGECLGMSNQSWNHPAPPETRVVSNLSQYIRLY